MTRQPAEDDTRWMLVFGAWLIALVATLGAVFLGEIVGRTPCVLCWYQRIAMFPLVIVLGVGLLPFDPRSTRYALPLAAIGWAVAFYHSLLYWGVVTEPLTPCSQGIPCADARMALTGFISIPLLSLVAFSLILVLLFFARKGSQK